MNDIVKTGPKVGGAIQALVPQSFDDAWRFAGALVKGGIAPKGWTQEQATAAIIAGMDLGLPPSRSVNSFAMINQRASLFGDAALGIVRASGFLERFEETQEPVEGVLTAVCKVWRKGYDQPTVVTFSENDAKKAGVWGKPGPWAQYPKRMLQMRARSFALRDTFTDLLCGFQVDDREEISSGGMKDITPQPQPESTISDDISAKLGLNNVIDIEPVPVTTDFDPETGEIIEGDFGLPPVVETAVQSEPTPAQEDEPEIDYQAMQAIVDSLKEKIDGALGKDTLKGRMAIIKKDGGFLSLSEPAQQAVIAYGQERWKKLPAQDPTFQGGAT